MPKSAAERVRAYHERKRKLARERGVCITCCKQKASGGRSTCDGCSRSASRRTTTRRVRLREGAQLRHVVLGHERAGDAAGEHHLFDDASQHYEHALKIGTFDSAAELRISEKLAHALARSENPKAAKPWFEKVLAGYLKSPNDAAKTIGVLHQMVRQSSVDANMEEVLRLRKQALEIADQSGDEQLRKTSRVQLASTLAALDRSDETARCLFAVGDPEVITDIEIRALYYSTKAIVLSIGGKARETYRCFDRAMLLISESNDLYRITAMWNNYANQAVVLGDIGIAKNCCEKALIIARRNNLGWRIPYFCLLYAELLFRIGRYDSAHEYLIEALSYDADVPKLDQLFASVGIPLALHFKDEKILAGCANPAAVEIAFRSGQPSYIALIAAAFAQLYAVRGQHKKAQNILHRSLESANVCTVAQSVDFPAAVARFAAPADLPRTRALLEARTKLPDAVIAHAHLAMFDAYVERRNKKWKESSRLAFDAAGKFDALNWHGYADIARSMIPTANLVSSRHSTHDNVLSDLVPVLTAREQQIVELVIKGFTNRRIATELSISRHTVESHMKSIMNSLGVRSRHQLGGILRQPEP